MHCCCVLITGYIVYKSLNPAWLGFPIRDQEVGCVDWKGFSVPASACGNAECWLPPDTPPPPSPEFVSAGLAWGQLFAVSQVMLVAQGTHFENPLFQGTFLGTYWNTQQIPWDKRWASCPPFRVPGSFEGCPS